MTKKDKMTLPNAYTRERRTYQHQIKVLTLEGSIKAQTTVSLCASLQTDAGKNKTTLIRFHERRDGGRGTHDGWHVVALVGGRHQCAEVRLAAHAHSRRTLVLHVLGHSTRRQQPRGGAVVTEAAIS